MPKIRLSKARIKFNEDGSVEIKKGQYVLVLGKRDMQAFKKCFDEPLHTVSQIGLVEHLKDLCQHGNYHCNICEVALLKKVIGDYQNSIKEILTLSELELDYEGTLQTMSKIYKTALFVLPKEMIG